MKKFSALRADMSPQEQQLAASKAKAMNGGLDNSARFPDGAFKSSNFKVQTIQRGLRTCWVR
jgi:hypothetical protein